MIIDDVNKAKITAIKNKDENAKSALGNIKSKYLLLQSDKRAKNEDVTDADVVNILLKIVKELEEEKENFKKVNNMTEVTNLEEQKKVVESFLPKMMSKEEIADIISSLPEKTVPVVMKHFKENYAGKVNMKDVKDVLSAM